MARHRRDDAPEGGSRAETTLLATLAAHANHDCGRSPVQSRPHRGVMPPAARPRCACDRLSAHAPEAHEVLRLRGMRLLEVDIGLYFICGRVSWRKPLVWSTASSASSRAARCCRRVRVRAGKPRRSSIVNSRIQVVRHAHTHACIMCDGPLWPAAHCMGGVHVGVVLEVDFGVGSGLPHTLYRTGPHHV